MSLFWEGQHHNQKLPSHGGCSRQDVNKTKHHRSYGDTQEKGNEIVMS